MNTQPSLNTSTPVYNPEGSGGTSFQILANLNLFCCIPTFFGNFGSFAPTSENRSQPYYKQSVAFVYSSSATYAPEPVDLQVVAKLSKR